MPQTDEQRALSFARALGVAQEALRLGHRRIGTEHVLMASFADPVVRWVLTGAGCNLREVQSLVTQQSVKRNRQRCAEFALTPEAVVLMLRVSAQVPGFRARDRAPDPRLFSMALQALLVVCLRAEPDTAAARILDVFGGRAHQVRLVTAIRQNSGPLMRPRTA